MLDDMLDFLDQNNVASFRKKQLNDAYFKQFVEGFDDIKQFPKDLREKLKQNFNFSTMELVDESKNADTIKFVLKTKDGNFIESVLMNHFDGRRTVCVSSQVFCALGCKFCATGANSFRRNLKCDEIIGQVLFVSRYLKKANERVSNIVFMGMGEPFLNYDEVISAIRILNDEDKFNIGSRHITVSTSGIVPRIYDYASFDIRCRLAISLHAPNDTLRSKLMPINKKYPLLELMRACDDFTKKTNKRVSYEYVLINGVNDSSNEALELIKLLKGRLAHVNLLIYNPHEFSDFKRPDKNRVFAFKKILDENGIENSIRKSLGDDISGACGQLSLKVGNKS